MLALEQGVAGKHREGDTWYVFLPEAKVVTFGVVGETRAPCAHDHLLPSPRAHSCADACPDPMEKTCPITRAPSRYLRTPFFLYSASP